MSLLLVGVRSRTQDRPVHWPAAKNRTAAHLSLVPSTLFIPAHETTNAANFCGNLRWTQMDATSTLRYSTKCWCARSCLSLNVHIWLKSSASSTLDLYIECPPKHTRRPSFLSTRPNPERHTINTTWNWVHVWCTASYWRQLRSSAPFSYIRAKCDAHDKKTNLVFLVLKQAIYTVVTT